MEKQVYVVMVLAVIMIAILGIVGALLYFKGMKKDNLDLKMAGKNCFIIFAVELFCFIIMWLLV